MKKAVLLLTLAVAAGLLSSAAASGPRNEKVLTFDTMIGVPRPYTGATNAVRGVPGGGLPWVVADAKGEIREGGRLRVEVKGLVFDPADADVIARGLAGINTVTSFKAVVSCLTKDAAGTAQTVNVSTGMFPADAAGNARIEETIELPAPCIAPIVFVTSPAGAWFAATGA